VVAFNQASSSITHTHPWLPSLVMKIGFRFALRIRITLDVALDHVSLLVEDQHLVEGGLFFFFEPMELGNIQTSSYLLGCCFQYLIQINFLR